MLGEEKNNPKDVVGHMKQFLYALNLLDCSTAAFIVPKTPFRQFPAETWWNSQRPRARHGSRFMLPSRLLAKYGQCDYCMNTLSSLAEAVADSCAPS